MNNVPLESEEQANFCDYLDSLGIIYTSTQNGAVLGGKNRFAQMKKLKRTGLKSGFPDLIIFTNNKSKTADVLFIEMKRQKLGVISPQQKEWINRLDNAGYSVGVAKGCESAKTILHKYLEG